MENVLITGGAGFLGRYVKDLFSAQHKVIVIDNLDPRCGGEYDNDLFRVDVTRFNLLDTLVKEYKIDTIIHLAAYGRNLTCQDFPRRAWEVNVNGTLNVLEIARTNRRVSRVVCCSSNITLSDQPTVYKETKLACENLVKLYSTLGVSCMGIRPSNIYGKGQSRKEHQPCAFAGMDIAFEKNGYFKITGDGSQTRDWVHAADVARAFRLAAESSVSGITVDVCTGNQASMNRVAELLGVKVQYVDPRPGDAQALISDLIPAEKEIGFIAERHLEDHIFDAFPALVAQKAA